MCLPPWSLRSTGATDRQDYFVVPNPSAHEDSRSSSFGGGTFRYARTEVLSSSNAGLLWCARAARSRVLGTAERSYETSN